jgi:hypothetical protein
MDAPFDRGEIDRASLDATERLRARLSGQPPKTTPAPRRAVLPWVLAVSLFVFTAGMIANPWFERSVRGQLPFVGAPVTTEAAAEATEVRKLQARIDQLENTGGGAIGAPAGERLARTEAKIETSAAQLAHDGERLDSLTSEVGGLTAKVNAETGRTEVAAAAAVAAAERAQGMIAVLLARQAIESGRRLNTVELVLRQSFETRFPQAVSDVVALGTAPVTLMSLRQSFPARALKANGAGLDWWQTLRQAVRSALTHSEDVLQSPDEAAAAALASGNVATAAKQLRRLPEPRSAATAAWLASADRLQAGTTALTTLETAAIMGSAEPPKE